MDVTPTLRRAEEGDFEFAFKVKREALGPYVASHWGWDELLQRELHRKRWNERPWSIVMVAGRSIGTVSVKQAQDHIRVGEFYLLAESQGKGIGSKVLLSVLQHADRHVLPVKLEHLKWNPVGSLYKRHGFLVSAENDTHYFLVRQPHEL